MKITLAYVTHENKEAAQQLINQMLEQRLIACANVLPIQSHYHWQGSIAHEDEIVTLLKTSPARWSVLVRFLEDRHPYDTPCIMHWEADANEPYARWVYESVNTGVI